MTVDAINEEITPVSHAEPAATGSSTPADGDLQLLWGRILEAVGRASPFTRTYLLEAHPVTFKGSLFTIGFDPQFEDHIGLVDNPRNHTLLQTKLAELGHPNTQFKFIKAEAPAPSGVREEAAAPAVAVAPPQAPLQPAPAAPTKPAVPALAMASSASLVKEKSSIPFNKDDFKNDPLIQKALEMFKGQIVEVRA